jgi:hypothetical protein
MSPKLWFLKSKISIMEKGLGIPCEEVKMNKSPGIVYECLHNCSLEHKSEQNPFHQTSKTGGATALATSAFR